MTCRDEEEKKTMSWGDRAVFVGYRGKLRVAKDHHAKMKINQSG